jgi:phage/plasmid-associated DNA primase
MQEQSDDKWWLLGFNNLVCDLRSGTFREYDKEDNISINTGYDWREPTDEEVQTVNSFISSIIPNEYDKKILLQILSTTLEGRCFDKFVMFQGSGSNGKSTLINFLLEALGNLGMNMDPYIIYQISTEEDSEVIPTNNSKSVLHKKRLVVLNDINSSIPIPTYTINELLSGKFKARDLYNVEVEKISHMTLITVTNSDLSFEDEIDTITIQFESIFTSDSLYSTRNFRETHKYAFIRLILNSIDGFIDR